MDFMTDLVQNFDLVLFILIGIVVIISAFLVLEAKNLTHAIIFLSLTFAGMAVIYIILSAEFIAMIQMTVYTGGVIILFLFALMLTRSEEFNIRGDLNRGVSVLYAFILFFIFVFIALPISDLWINNINPFVEINNFPYGIAWVGFSLFNYYQIGFLILGLIVVSALIGAIYIIKNEAGEDIRVVSPSNPNQNRRNE